MDPHEYASIAQWRKSLQKAIDAGATREAAINCETIGDLLRRSGDYKQALAFHRLEILLCRKMDSLCEIAKAHRFAGLCYQALGMFRQARDAFSLDIDVHRDLAEGGLRNARRKDVDPLELQRALCAMGNLHESEAARLEGSIRREAKLEDALELYRASLDEARRLRERPDTERRGAALERDALLNVGNMHFERESFVDAERCFRQAQALCPKRSVAHANFSIQIGAVLLATKRLDAAARIIGDAAGVLEQKRRTGHGVSDDLSRAYFNLAQARVKQLRLDAADRLFRRARAAKYNADACAEALSHVDGLRKAKAELDGLSERASHSGPQEKLGLAERAADLCAELGDFEAEAKWRTEALRLNPNLGDADKAQAYGMIGESLTRSGHGLAAAEWHKKEAAIYRAQGLRAKEAVAKDSLASALEEGGKPHEEVLAVYRKALALAQEAGSCETQSAILENIYLTMGELKKPTAAQRRERETVLARLLSLRDEDSDDDDDACAGDGGAALVDVPSLSPAEDSKQPLSAAINAAYDSLGLRPRPAAPADTPAQQDQQQRGNRKRNSPRKRGVLASATALSKAAASPTMVVGGIEDEEADSESDGDAWATGSRIPTRRRARRPAASPRRRQPRARSSSSAAAVTQVDEADSGGDSSSGAQSEENLKPGVSLLDLAACQGALSAAERDRDRASEAMWCLQVAAKLLEVGRPSDALGYAQRSLQIGADVSDKGLQMDARHAIGDCYAAAPDPERAAAQYDAWLRIAEARKETYEVWGACLRLAAANLDMAAEPSRTRNEASELIQRARAAAERSVRAAESPEGAPELERKRASMRQQSALMRAECLSKPVVREAPSAALRNAIPLYKQALRLARDSRQHIMYVLTCVAAGRAQLRLAGSDGVDAAERHARAALRYCEENHDANPGDAYHLLPQKAQACALLGDVHTADGNFELARRAYEDAIRLLSGDPADETPQTRARLHTARQALGKCRRCIEAKLRLPTLDTRLRNAGATAQRGLLAEAVEAYSSARDYTSVIRCGERLLPHLRGAAGPEAELLRRMSDAAAAMGRPAAARGYLRRECAIYQQSHDREAELDCLLAISKVSPSTAGTTWASPFRAAAQLASSLGRLNDQATALRGMETAAIARKDAREQAWSAAELKRLRPRLHGSAAAARGCRAGERCASAELIARDRDVERDQDRRRWWRARNRARNRHARKARGRSSNLQRRTSAPKRQRPDSSAGPASSSRARPNRATRRVPSALGGDVVVGPATGTATSSPRRRAAKKRKTLRQSRITLTPRRRGDAPHRLDSDDDDNSMGGGPVPDVEFGKENRGSANSAPVGRPPSVKPNLATVDQLAKKGAVSVVNASPKPGVSSTERTAPSAADEIAALAREGELSLQKCYRVLTAQSKAFRWHPDVSQALARRREQGSMGGNAWPDSICIVDTAVGWAELGAVLRALALPECAGCRLRELDVSCTRFDDDCAVALADMCADAGGPLARLTTLRLSLTMVSAAGFATLLPSLSALPRLTELDLSYTRLDDAALTALVECLAKVPSLRSLSLEGCLLKFESRDAKRLRLPKTLERLSVKACPLSCNGLRTLLDALSRSETRLLELDLSDLPLEGSDQHLRGACVTLSGVLQAHGDTMRELKLGAWGCRAITYLLAFSTAGLGSLSRGRSLSRICIPFSDMNASQESRLSEALLSSPAAKAAGRALVLSGGSRRATAE